MLTKFLSNKREIYSGALVGAAFTFNTPFLIPALLVCAILWRLGGMYGHSIRVVGIPAALSLTYSLVFKNPYMALLLLAAFPLSLGYGIADATDSGSWLGGLVSFYTKGKQPLTNIFTRGIYAALVSFGFIALLPFNFIAYLIGSILFVSGYILINLK